MMQGPEMQQLRQRVIASYHLGPLDTAETQAYIEHRLRARRLEGRSALRAGGFDAIHARRGGIPRRINTLCNRLLLAGFLGEKHAFGAADVAGDRARDPRGARPPSRHCATDRRSPRRARESAPSGKAASNGAALASRASARHRGANRPAGADGRRRRRSAAPAAAPGPCRQARVAREPVMGEIIRPAGPMVCVVGARPNYMKMAPLVRAFAKRPGLPASCSSTPASTTTSR